MSKAAEWAARMKSADTVEGFSWQRVKDLERERPTFVLREPSGYERAMLLTVGPDGQLSLEDMWIPRERAIAAARWILDTFGDDS